MLACQVHGKLGGDTLAKGDILCHKTSCSVYKLGEMMGGQ